MSRRWYEVRAAADPAVAEILIRGDIGPSFWGDDTVTAQALLQELAQLPTPVRTIIVRINSLGGSPFDATAIANGLRDQHATNSRTVETIVEGVAASAASIVAMAGQTVKMYENALLMIHRAWTFTIGNREDHQQTVAALDAIDQSIIHTYRWHSQLSTEEIASLMAAETWFSADEAIAQGFATEKIAAPNESDSTAASALTSRVFASVDRVPAPLRAQLARIVRQPEAPTSAAPAAVLALCREAECLELAEELVNAGATLEQVNARLEHARAAKTAEASRIATINGICQQFKMHELAAAYIAGGMTVDAVRAQIGLMRGVLDRALGDIDSGLPISQMISGSRQSEISAGWKQVIRRVQQAKQPDAATLIHAEIRR